MYIGDFNKVCANSVLKFAEVDNADSPLIMQNSTLVSINVYHAEFYINSHTPEFEIQMVKSRFEFGIQMSLPSEL